MKSLSRVRLSATPWTAASQAPPSMNFPGKSTGVGCHFLLQGIFPTQGLDPGLPHCRQTFLSSKPPGKPFLGGEVYKSQENSYSGVDDRSVITLQILISRKNICLQIRWSSIIQVLIKLIFFRVGI